ncbi:MAG: tetratricopeptide repeat protein, partial [Acidimicrobiia bacterium]
MSVALALLLSFAHANVPTGDRLVDQGNFADAVAAYHEVLAQDPDDAVAHARLARAAVYQADDLPGGRHEAKEALF